MHWRRRRCIGAVGAKQLLVSHRDASPMHRRCGAIFRPQLPGPYLGGLGTCSGTCPCLTSCYNKAVPASALDSVPGPPSLYGRGHRGSTALVSWAAA
eukprot:2700645-Pyramimonas_sp.AAC.1